jgi:hypothetical protein
MASKTRKTISQFRTEADGTTCSDIWTWLRDNYGDFVRKEISLDEYETRRATLLARMDALRVK